MHSHGILTAKSNPRPDYSTGANPYLCLDQMVDDLEKPILVIIVGPTGSGKSALSLRLAQHFSGEVINCDSMQLYRGLDIGTGKVLQQERTQIPHHLLDIIEPDGMFSAGDYVLKVRSLLPEITGRGAIPMMVGGTGLYLRALLRGLFEGPPRNEALRARLQRMADKGRLPRLHAWLARVDKESGLRIMPRDRLRIFRALEVYLLTGKPISQHFQESHQPLSGYRPLWFGLNPPREELYGRIHLRVERMMAAGWIREVQDLLCKGIPAEAQAFAALGYRQIIDHLQGKITREELVEKICIATRHYAKRQWTWFRSEPAVQWVDCFGDQEQAFRFTRELILKRMGME